MNYNYSICPVCGRPIATETSPFTADIACRCQWQVTITQSNGTTASPDAFNQHLKDMRAWKVTLHGQVNGQKKPVPSAFQDAFKDGELEP